MQLGGTVTGCVTRVLGCGIEIREGDLPSLEVEMDFWDILAQITLWYLAVLGIVCMVALPMIIINLWWDDFRRRRR